MLKVLVFMSACMYNVCIRIGCPKSLGHFLMPLIAKTTMHGVKFERYLERKISVAITEIYTLDTGVYGHHSK